LATVIVPTARQADGVYAVNIRLQPADLGVVHVAMRVEAGTVNLSLHADGGATGDLLRQNLGHLRQELSSAGLSTGRFDVSTGGQPGAWRPQAQAQQPQSGLSGEPAFDHASTPLPAPDPGAPAVVDGQLDVRL
jgi:flagellar hook-length control protein FliK